MCHACIVEGAKREMLSRRQLFRGAAALGAASVAAGAISARPLLAQASGQAVDLTHAYDETFPTFFGDAADRLQQAVLTRDGRLQPVSS